MTIYYIHDRTMESTWMFEDRKSAIMKLRELGGSLRKPKMVSSFGVSYAFGETEVTVVVDRANREYTKGVYISSKYVRREFTVPAIRLARKIEYDRLLN